MDDYSMTSLSDSRNEWCARLVNTLTPCIIEGLKSIFEEAWKLCVENDEEDKYLMTFQTFLSRIPKWNSEIIETEKKRIEESSNCGYLEELITCVHIIQLKALTCVRVGQKQKKVDIDIPSVDVFTHKIYCNVARKLYTNIYLFEKDIMPLDIQRHNRELEVIIRECVLNTVRDTMPVENILRAYIDETEELDVNEEIIIVDDNVEENTQEDVAPPIEVTEMKSINEPTDINITKAPAMVLPAELSNEVISTKHVSTSPVNFSDNSSPAGLQSSPPTPQQIDVVTPTLPISHMVLPQAISPQLVAAVTAPHVAQQIAAPSGSVNFNDTDDAVDVNGSKSNIHAPKTDERLEQIAELSSERRKREEEEEEEEDKIRIGGNINLDIMDINDLNRPIAIERAPILNDIEVLS